MAKQNINIGTSENKGDGESLRSAFSKVNDNFDELYGALGLGDGTLNVGAFTFTGSVIDTDDSSNITINKPVTVNGEIVVDGDITPATNFGANLGTPSKRFKDLYLSSNSIDLGGTVLSVAGGELQLGGVKIPTTADVAATVASAVSAPAGDLTGSVFADDNTLLVDAVAGKIVGPVDTATITASALNLNISARNYVWIDSNEGGSIVIGQTASTGPVVVGRAGGTFVVDSNAYFNGDIITNSIASPATGNLELDVGRDNGGAFIVTAWEDKNDAENGWKQILWAYDQNRYSFFVGGDVDAQGSVNVSQNLNVTNNINVSSTGVITTSSTDKGLVIEGPLTANMVPADPENPGTYTTVSNGVNIRTYRIGDDLERDWTFSWDGSLYPPYDANSSQVGAIEWRNPNFYGQIKSTPGYDNEFGTEPASLKLLTYNDISGGAIILQPGSDTAKWIFDTDSSLTFPDATVQTTAWTGNAPGLTYIDPGEGLPTQVGLDADTFDFGTGNTVDLQGNSVLFNGATISDFAPGSIYAKNGQYLYVASASASATTTNVAFTYDTNISNVRQTFYGKTEFGNNGQAPIVDFTGATVTGLNPTTMGNTVDDINLQPNRLTFNTITNFTTATAPLSSKGAAGDYHGDVAFDSNYIYYCTGAYVAATWANSATVDIAGGGTGGSGIALHLTTVPSVGWYLSDGTSASAEITQVVPQGDYYVLIFDQEIAFNLNDTVYYGASVPAQADIWKRVAWSSDTW